MNTNEIPTVSSTPLNRRRFIAGASATVGLTLLQPELVRGAEANSKITIGLIGCGGRGKWIADLFQKHGGYQLAAVADYFQDRADEAGAKLNVEPAKRFTGLDGYRLLLEQPLDAVVIETPPYFHPFHAAAAVDAGKHVYLAKPIAVDVPGCRRVEDSGRKASANKKVFLVDFQTRASEPYREVVRRVREGMIGRIVSIEAAYHCGLTWEPMDAFLRKDPNSREARLRAWGLDRTLSGDVITEQNIHALDVATWFLDAAPVKAVGGGGKARSLLGDCWDHFAVLFTFPDDTVVTFNSKQVGYAYDDILCRAFGTNGTADTHYFGEVWVKSKEDGYKSGPLGNLYTDGAVANIAAFHKAVTSGDFSNPTIAPSVRSTLTTILGRTAAYKKGEVTWTEMMRAAEEWKFDLSGLKS